MSDAQGGLMWVASSTVGFICDPATGGFRKCVNVYVDCAPADMIKHGAIMRVFGDTDEDARALAARVCAWHNGGLA
jgi:hypothetical protein